jgi:hypothetical protein
MECSILGLSDKIFNNKGRKRFGKNNNLYGISTKDWPH